jgi:hypothetical protein
MAAVLLHSCFFQACFLSGCFIFMMLKFAAALTAP